jgi:hypothetical protein
MHDMVYIINQPDENVHTYTCHSIMHFRVGCLWYLKHVPCQTDLLIICDEHVS